MISVLRIIRPIRLVNTIAGSSSTATRARPGSSRLATSLQEKSYFSIMGARIGVTEHSGLKLSNESSDATSASEQALAQQLLALLPPRLAWLARPLPRVRQPFLQSRFGIVNATNLERLHLWHLLLLLQSLELHPLPAQPSQRHRRSPRLRRSAPLPPSVPLHACNLVPLLPTPPRCRARSAASPSGSHGPPRPRMSPLQGTSQVTRPSRKPRSSSHSQRCPTMTPTNAQHLCNRSPRSPHPSGIARRGDGVTSGPLPKDPAAHQSHPVPQ